MGTGCKMRPGRRCGGAFIHRLLPSRRMRIVTLVAAMAAAVMAFGSANADYADGLRTEQATTLPDAVKVWRQEAWQRDDFLSQIRLGDLYSTNQSIGPGESKNGSFYDPVEAYVWYFLALRSGHDYRADDNNSAYDQAYSLRSNASSNAEQIFSNLTFEQRLDARARILYVLSSRGAEGFLTLGRIHASGWDGTNSGGRTKKQYVMLCVRSSWDHWYSSWLWWIWSSLTGKIYPHLPVWKWVSNTDDNWNARLPDYQCQGADLPPEPKDNYTLPSGSFGSTSSGSLAQSTGSDVQGPAVAPSGGTEETASVTVSGSSQSYSTSGSGSSSSYYTYGYRGLSSVFEPNDAEALTYFQIASALGHPLASAYVRSERSTIKYYSADASRIIAEAEKRARFWSPPYEYYPGITAKGKLHSDESLPTLDERMALKRVRELPVPAILEALDFRGYSIRGRLCGPPPLCLKKAVEQFQAALDLDATGFLTPEQTVRLIQMAAVDGDAIAQDRLGIMYAKGIGVPQNFVRAEKWFVKAANQRYPDALFNLSVLYRVGPNGVEPDEAKAGSYAAQAIAAGYITARCEITELLRQADAGGHDHPVGARR